MDVHDAPLLNSRDAFTPVLYRVNDFVLNLTLPHLIAYDIETPETLELVVPRQAVLSDQPIAMPPIVIFPVSGGVQVNGSLLDGVDENLMRERPQGGRGRVPGARITLSNETWAENLGAGPNPETVAFAAGLVADEENTNYCQKVDRKRRLLPQGRLDGYHTARADGADWPPHHTPIQ